MQATKKRKRPLLRPVVEDSTNEDEDLMTKEEIDLIKETKNIQKYAFKRNKEAARNVRSDQLTSDYENMRGNNSNNNNRSNSRKANQSSMQFSSARRQDSSFDNEEDDEDISIRQLNDEEVKEMFQDVLHKRTSTQRKNNNYQDQFCSILAQMILKNKINKENAFEIPLPDVKDMSDFAKVSEASWQKLSSSLDSGAKIYGYRVDSLHQESFKMLGGLIRSEYQYGNVVAEEQNDDETNEDIINREREKLLKRPKKVSEETIEKNVSNITLARYDIQFEVDPLFCKTSARFDDASSKGILLNNISIDDKLKLMMDSEKIDQEEQVSSETVFKPTSLDRRKFTIRSDLQSLELCSGLENFVANMLSFDLDESKIVNGFSGQKDEDMYASQDDYVYGENEEREQCIEEIDVILSQTARKRQRFLFGEQTSSQKVQFFSSSPSAQKDFYSSPVPQNDSISNSQQLEKMAYSQRSQDSQHLESQFKSAPVLLDQNIFEFDVLGSNDNDFNYQMEPLNQETGFGYEKQSDIPSSQSSNQKSDNIFEQNSRLFSIQNLAFRMNQVGNGSFFSSIEKEKNKWMNPTDWQVHKQKIEVFGVGTALGKQKRQIKKGVENEFRMDFYEVFEEILDKQEVLKGQNLGNKRQRQKQLNKTVPYNQLSSEIPQNSLISIDHHYNPKNLFKTSYLDVESIEESERQLKERQQIIQDEYDDYKGFNGDQYDIDEYTLLDDRFQNSQKVDKNAMEVIEDYQNSMQQIRSPNQAGEQFQSYSQYDIPGESQQPIERAQLQSQGMRTDQYDPQKMSKTSTQNLVYKKQNQRKMKIQELKTRLWENMDTQLKTQQEISYLELLQELRLEKSESASIQSCLVAVLHLCNEKNLQLFENEEQNFNIRFAQE